MDEKEHFRNHTGAQMMNELRRLYPPGKRPEPLYAPALPDGFRAVDAHIHLFPERLFEAIRRWFDEFAWNVLFKMPVPDLIAYLKRMGARHAACLVYAHRAGVAPELNRWLADLAAREPFIIPFGAFHQDDPPDAVLNEALDSLNLRGIKIHCNVQRVRADDPRLFPLYEHLTARGRILVIHAGTQPMRDEFVGLDNLRRALERFPEMHVQIAHLGDDEFDKLFALLTDFPNVFSDTSVIFNDREPHIPKEHHENVIRFADRILHGTDFPNIWYTPEAAAASFLACGFPEDILNKILFENADKFYRDNESENMEVRP